MSDKRFNYVEAENSPSAKCIEELKAEVARLKTDYSLLSSDYLEIKADNARLREALLFIRDECDWEPSIGSAGNATGGDSRIGEVVTKALAAVRDGKEEAK